MLSSFVTNLALPPSLFTLSYSFTQQRTDAKSGHLICSIKENVADENLLDTQPDAEVVSFLAVVDNNNDASFTPE